MPISTGQALALGNIARPDTTKVFTNAANTKIKLDLGRREAEAKQKAEQAKLQKELEGMVGFGKGGFDPLFQERASKIISKGVADQMNYAKNGDRIGINARKAQMEAELADLEAENKRFRGTLDEMERNGLSNKEITSLLNMRGSDAVKKYQEIIQARPEVQSFLNLDDPTQGKFTASYIKNVDLNNKLGEAVKALEKDAMPVKINGKSYTQVGNTKMYNMAANPQQRLAYAMDIASDKDAADNVKLLYPKEYNEAFSMLSRQAQGMPENELQQRAAAAVIDKQLEKKANYQFKEQDWRPRVKGSGINIGGFGAIKYDINGLPQAEKLNIKVKTNNGVLDRVVSTGNYYGFKPVEILNTKTDGVIDVENNEVVELPKGNTFDLIKVGEASAFPIAAKDFSTKSGVFYKKGQIVDDKAVAGLTQDGLVEYKPMIKGQVSYKTGDKRTVTKSVIIPANNIGRAVQISAGQGDAEPTTESINGAIREAQELTSNLNKRAKIKTNTQSPKVTKVTVDLSKFDKTSKQ